MDTVAENEPYYSIRSWNKFQHYKDRNPPWIKLHTELLNSRSWVALSDAGRVLAVASMLLASRTDNKIPLDPTYIQRRAYLNQPPDYQELIDIGFMDLHQPDGALIAGASTMRTNVRPETEAEAYKAEAEKPTDFRERQITERSSNGENSNALSHLGESIYQIWIGSWNDQLPEAQEAFMHLLSVDDRTNMKRNWDWVVERCETKSKEGGTTLDPKTYIVRILGFIAANMDQVCGKHMGDLRLGFFLQDRIFKSALQEIQAMQANGQ